MCDEGSRAIQFARAVTIKVAVTRLSSDSTNSTRANANVVTPLPVMDVVLRLSAGFAVVAHFIVLVPNSLQLPDTRANENA